MSDRVFRGLMLALLAALLFVTLALPHLVIVWMRFTSRWWTPRAGDRVLWKSVQGYQEFVITGDYGDQLWYRIRQDTPVSSSEVKAKRQDLIFVGRDHA